MDGALATKSPAGPRREPKNPGCVLAHLFINLLSSGRCPGIDFLIGESNANTHSPIHQDVGKSSLPSTTQARRSAIQAKREAGEDV